MVIDGLDTDLHLAIDSGESSNPLNEFATDLTMNDVDRIQEYAFSNILLQR